MACRIAAQDKIEESASPIAGNKRRREVTDSDPEEDPPAGKRMATDQAVMAALVRLEKKFDAANERLRDCAQKMTSQPSKSSSGTKLETTR